MRFTTPLLCLIVVALVPATASAKLAVGISDNHPVMFADPNFAQLGAKHVRIVASWNSFTQGSKGDDEFSAKVAPYVQGATAQGADVLVAFEHSRGAPPDCRKSHKGPCKLPSVAAYKAEITKFLTALPQVKYVSAWNEANHPTQPTQGDPARAGQYAKAADQVCATLGTCKVLAMDILDAANDPTVPTSKLNYSRTISYIKKLRSAYGKTPAICGIHNYADVNRFRTSGTKAVAKAGRCKSYWLTETGGFYKFASFWRAETRKNAVGKCTNSATCQVAALKYLFSHTVKSAKHIDRAYIYNFYSGEDGRFDAGITKGKGTAPTGTKRPSFNIVKSHI